MNELQIFNNEEFGNVRSLMIDNEPWFVGKDVAEALGYKNVRDSLARHIDSDDKREKPASVYSFRSGISGSQRLHRLPGGAASCSGRGDSGSGHPECGMARTHGGDPGRSLSGWRSQ